MKPKQLTIEGAVRRKEGGAPAGPRKALELRPLVMKVFDTRQQPLAEVKPASKFRGGTTGFDGLRRPIRNFETELSWLGPELATAFDALERGGGVEELKQIRAGLEKARKEAESAMNRIDAALAEIQKEEGRRFSDEAIEARRGIWTDTVAELTRLPRGIKQHIDEHKLLDKLDEIISAQ